MELVRIGKSKEERKEEKGKEEVVDLKKRNPKVRTGEKANDQYWNSLKGIPRFNYCYLRRI